VTIYISVEQLLAVHAALVEQFGGSSGLRDRGGLEAAAARPAMTFDGEDLYPDVCAKAAALMHSLVMNHPFVDGNKRVGALAAEAFLEINSHRILASDEELEDVTMATARGELDTERLAIWLRQRTTRAE
jgi:death-on-curing protein